MINNTRRGVNNSVPASKNATTSVVPPSNGPTNEPNVNNELSTTTTTSSFEYRSRIFKPRYVGPSNEDEMTQQQIDIRNEILKSRPRTGLSGPFGPWLSCPSICSGAQQLGRTCRYETSLSFYESEMIILLTGAYTGSDAEFDIHVDEGVKAGISWNIIHSIPRRHDNDDYKKNSYAKLVKARLIPLIVEEKNKSGLNAQRLCSIVLFTSELLETYKVSDETYKQTKAALDNKDSVLVEITSIVGYYTYAAYTLNVFQIATTTK